MISIDYDPKIKMDNNLIDIIKKAITIASSVEKCPYNIDVYVEIVDEATIQAINGETRDKHMVTDVLSFPMLEYEEPSLFPDLSNDPSAYDLDTGNVYLGDIILCLDRAKKQAKDYNHSLEREVGFLTVHSMLHLFGYDHMTIEDEALMRKRQQVILGEMGLSR